MSSTTSIETTTTTSATTTSGATDSDSFPGEVIEIFPYDGAEMAVVATLEPRLLLLLVVLRLLLLGLVLLALLDVGPLVA